MKKKIEEFVEEFKKFIMRGNVLDLAVGVIIGGAFGKIVTSLVNDIIMPFIGVILGGLDFTGLKLKIKDAEILYGSFIQNVIDFLIVAFCVFIFVKLINNFMNHIEEKRKELDKKEEKEQPQEEPKKTEDILLLEEIRDLLKKNNKK